jgi:hypothetical protein
MSACETMSASPREADIVNSSSSRAKEIVFVQKTSPTLTGPEAQSDTFYQLCRLGLPHHFGAFKNLFRLAESGKLACYPNLRYVFQIKTIGIFALLDPLQALEVPANCRPLAHTQTIKELKRTYALLGSIKIHHS